MNDCQSYSRMFLRVIAVAIVLAVFAKTSALKAETFDAGKPAELVTFSLTTERIEDAVLSNDGRLWIRLDQTGARQLHEVTTAEMWKQLDIMINGHPALRFMVVHEIDNGRLVIEQPEEALLKTIRRHFQ